MAIGGVVFAIDGVASFRLLLLCIPLILFFGRQGSAHRGALFVHVQKTIPKLVVFAGDVGINRDTSSIVVSCSTRRCCRTSCRVTGIKQLGKWTKFRGHRGV
ncbi:hypothetical protein BDB00DRAFT_813307 [Zychaea mexicana]|uniref:uncharacterized protein n=1 Tax=Zychaea mexicana TaxID=64656 RepID=UPI0022FDB751|nr:uncharacterized protein BDB00DRAFT_813307 [Zychaea mexicana]KAI9495742.1 hypothetical protein BDB00DRAFT_813307 [Zychaea mexicana]